MFRNRNSQKPNEEFYAAFKHSFPNVGPGSSSSAGERPVLRSTSLSDALTDAHVPHRQFGDLDAIKDPNDTPKPVNDSWRFTPSLMDPNSFAFASFANQPPGYYTPTPGGVNTLYHSQAGDLHTPGMGMNIGTPLSLPHTTNALEAHDHSMADLQHFQSHFLQSHPFQTMHPYGQQTQMQPQQDTFHPSSFLQHQDSGYEAMDGTPEKSPPNATAIRGSQQTQMMHRPSEATMKAPFLPVGGEKFRYHVVLNAPTAMIKHADEIPVTYLNKGQAYTMSVVDTMPFAPTPGPVKYRTFVRVSFEDEQQRAKPSACWQLWKEGRGTNEAHQRGGKLLAVEYVDPNQGGDDTRTPQITVESASFDGFCVTWTPNPMTGAADCAISVRFNFLSTDFSHSKGVKGIPVRLCAKTEMLNPTGADPALTGEPEVCYCKVKLFRDHGAERKLSNDVAHVKKTIEKLKQQIQQAESGMGGFGKRKRSGSSSKAPMNRPGKVMKHKRTWSIDSDGDGTSRPSAEEDLHIKLATMQDMFSSTQPASVLYLRGDPEDDADNFPVQLTGDTSELINLSRTQTWESKQSPESTPQMSNIVSPTPSSYSLASGNRSVERKASIVPSVSQPQSVSRHGSMDWARPQSPEKAMKIPKRSSLGGDTSFIKAIGVDSSYIPPSEQPAKPVACLYVSYRQSNATRSGDLYRAIYLMRRGVSDLINGISSKFAIDASHVTGIVRVNAKGMRIVVDEDVVKALPEGQDMYIEFHEAQSGGLIKHDTMNASEILGDGNLDFPEASSTDGLELRLYY